MYSHKIFDILQAVTERILFIHVALLKKTHHVSEKGINHTYSIGLMKSYGALIVASRIKHICILKQFTGFPRLLENLEKPEILVKSLESKDTKNRST